MTEKVRDAQMSDEALTATQAGGGGYGRAAGYLLKLPVELRAVAESEGTIKANTSPGTRYADAIGAVVDRFLRGYTSTPLVDWNRAVIKAERQGLYR